MYVRMYNISATAPCAYGVSRVMPLGCYLLLCYLYLPYLHTSISPYLPTS